MVRQENARLTKKELAQRLGVSRSSLYYRHKQPVIDEEVKRQIESVLTENPAYGHKRVALALKLNRKRILRVMKKFNIKPYRRRKKPRKKGDENKPEAKFSNLIKGFCAIVPNLIWVSDFTYIRFKDRFIYLATLMDMYTREVVGWNVARFHNQELVLGALEHALSNSGQGVPVYLHSDQGTEYNSQAYVNIAQDLGIKISMSRKASPWENSHQESFYSQFKVDLGDVNQFDELGELIEAIHQKMHYYNYERIHSTLEMPPVEFRKQIEKLSKKDPHSVS